MLSSASCISYHARARPLFSYTFQLYTRIFLILQKLAVFSKKPAKTVGFSFYTLFRSSFFDCRKRFFLCQNRMHERKQIDSTKSRSFSSSQDNVWAQVNLPRNSELTMKPLEEILKN